MHCYGVLMWLLTGPKKKEPNSKSLDMAWVPPSMQVYGIFFTRFCRSPGEICEICVIT